jgi:hypothetical protein
MRERTIRLSSLVIVFLSLAVVAAGNVRASEATMGVCTRICTTFCPAGDFCATMGCRDVPAFCQDRECWAPVYVFPKTVNCFDEPE